MNRLEALLDRLLVDISQQSIELSVKGSSPKPTDAKYHDFYAKLEGYEKKLGGVVHQLGTIESQLDFRTKRAWMVPRTERYRVHQSIRSHGDHAQQVYQKAARVERSLRELFGQAGTPTTSDIIKGADKLLKELEKTLSQQEHEAVVTQLAKGQPHFEALQRDQPVVTNVPIGFLVSLIIVWIAARKNKG